MTGVQTCALPDRKSTRLNSSHTIISHAVFCLKKKTAREGCEGALSSVLGETTLLDAENHEVPGLVERVAEASGTTLEITSGMVFFLMLRQPPRSTPFPNTHPSR